MSARCLVVFLCLLAVSLAAPNAPPLQVALTQLLDAALDVVAPVSPVLGDSPCRQQALLYRNAVKQGQPWAIRMVDAGSKLPPGLLEGNLVQLGNYDECLRVRHEDPDVGVVEGQHCLVSLGVNNSFSAVSILDKSFLGAVTTSYFQRMEALLEHEGVVAAFKASGSTWAVCVPAACSAAQLELHLRSALPDIPLHVKAEACSSRVDADPAWDWQAALAVVLLSLLIALLAVGTVYDLTDHSTEPEKRPHPITAFSLYSNGRHLFGAPYVATDGDVITCLDGVRSLATLALVLAHTYLFTQVGPVFNCAEVEGGVQSWLLLPMASASLYVDTFLVLSGTLLALNYFRQRERKENFSLKRFYLNRYFRIAPAQIVAMLVGVASAPFSSSLADGPWLKSSVAPLNDNCRSARWLGLLYIGNLVDQEHMCQGSAWYLNIEMQLLLLSPLVLYPLWRKPRVGFALLGLLSLVGIVIVFNIAYEHSLRVVSIFNETLTSPNMDLTYFRTQTRYVPWLLGLAVGALLSRRVAPSPRQTALGWCVCAGLVYYSMLSPHASFQHDFVHDRLHSAIFFALVRPAWALANAWLIYACASNSGGFWNAFLGWRGWKQFSRLSYGVLLSHFAILSCISAASRTSRHVSHFDTIVRYWGIVVVSLFAAVVQHLAVEMPCFILYHKYQSQVSTKSQEKKKDT